MEDLAKALQRLTWVEMVTFCNYIAGTAFKHDDKADETTLIARDLLIFSEQRLPEDWND